MPSRDSLFQQILKHPDDDALRLRYADAITASDPDHAELIRVQLQTFERRAALDDADLLDRETSLKIKLARKLGDAVRHVFHITRTERGFPIGGVADAQTFLDDEGAVFSIAPITHLQLQHAAPAAFFYSPLLARLRTLSLIDAQVHDRDVQALAANPALTQLRALNLARNHITDHGVRALVASPHLASLRFVDLHDNPCDDPSLGELAEGPIVHTARLPPAGAALVEEFGDRAWITDPDPRPSWL